MHDPFAADPTISFRYRLTLLAVVQRIEASNRAFWSMKFTANKSRNRRVNLTLRKDCWYVLRIWEHDVKDDGIRVVSRIRKTLAADR